MLVSRLLPPRASAMDHASLSNRKGHCALAAVDGDNILAGDAGHKLQK